MITSAPSASWTSVARSGERNCLEPSRWERKVTPSSRMVTMPGPLALADPAPDYPG